MVESLQMFLFLFKSKYRRKFSWFSQFLCSVLIVLLFCHGVIARCSELNCVNGVCKNETCVCFEGWQGTECQYCGGKIMLTSPTGVITDGPGNYSVSTQCSWLLSPPWPGASPPPIRIRLESFATECGWDHLYIYDGDSVRATKLLAVFSGVLDPDDAGRTRQVVAHSGSALLHFFSDDAFAMEGFNVTYAVGSCPSDDHRTNCSSHGECDETNGSCRCDPEWKGTACDEPVCPEECNAKLSYGSCTQGGCQCVRGRAGVACERDVNDAGWDKLWSDIGEDDSVPRGLPPAAAGASLLNYNDDLLRVGGETFGDADFLYRYKVSEQVWRKVETVGASPAARFAHSAIMYGHELIVYGGVVASDQPERGGGLAGLEGRSGSVTNEIWRIQLDSAGPQWSNMTPTNCSPHRQPPLRHCGGLHISGHTAVLTFLGATKKPVMLVFFGHSPHYGYLHLVQEYYIDEGVWSVANTKGWPARAGFGHTAAYDELSRKVYVHGGLVSESEASQAPSSALHEYDAESRVWRPLPSAPTPRYLHSAIFVAPGVMLVVGGNAHNDTAAAASAGPSGAQCYCQWGFLYHARCRTWTQISTPMALSRAMHSTAMLPLRDGKTAVVYGGFDGRLRSDAWTFTLGARCSSIDDATRCVAAPHCVWDLTKLMCLSIEEIGWKSSFDGSVKACNDEPIFDSRGCGAATSCGACAARGCAWCGACYAAHHFCVRHSRTAFTVEECGENNESLREVCGRYHSCAACHAHHHHHHNMHSSEEPQRACYWDYDTIKCKPANSSDDIRSVSGGPACSATCATLHTCANCTSEECIWCASAGRCVDKNAYGASFPLGGCRAWSTNSVSRACSAGAAAGCGGLATCAACRAEPACGWCDDGAGGGRGECMPGGGSAPHTKICAHRWHFTQCPACQCNGHSLCDEESRCMQPCAGRSVGAHCDTCAPGHWGSSLNGHHCQPCECNAQAVACAPDTGRCYCSTKGLAGDRCDKCDNTNHYHADIYNTKACYYDLAVDYQFTFNLSKKEDRHLSAINFRNAPVKPDVDADFTITCSAHARMNLTVRTRTDPTEKTLFSDVNCTNFRYKFLKSEHMFGIEHNVTLSTFFVYVYDFKPPLWIQISFSQYPKLNLQQFFITFSSCFLLLLLVAAALWKIKQKYDLYRRRQRLFVEMEQMASRPFSQVCVELEKGGGGTGVPAPVALEPCRGGRAAVLSLLVRLPTGGTGRAPPLGGLAVASALVTLGHHPTNNTKRPHH